MRGYPPIKKLNQILLKKDRSSPSEVVPYPVNRWPNSTTVSPGSKPGLCTCLWSPYSIYSSWKRLRGLSSDPGGYGSRELYSIYIYVYTIVLLIKIFYYEDNLENWKKIEKILFLFWTKI